MISLPFRPAKLQTPPSGIAHTPCSAPYQDVCTYYRSFDPDCQPPKTLPPVLGVCPVSPGHRAAKAWVLQESAARTDLKNFSCTPYLLIPGACPTQIPNLTWGQPFSWRAEYCAPHS